MFAVETSSVSSPLAIVDWVIVAVYVVLTIALGWFFGRKQSSAKDYFTGGGQMNWALIGVSLFATLLSTISYLSMPGEYSAKGPAIMTNLLAFPLVYFVVGYGLLPVYMRHRVTSAYELLEMRLGVSVRMLGATLFLLLRLMWMSFLVKVTAEALTEIIGLEDKWTPLIAVCTGLVAVIYTSLGGLRAVVITDFLQTLLLYGGALTVLIIVTIRQEGFGWFPTEWQPNWDHQPFFSLDPSVRVTVVGSILSFLTWYICTSGGDQVSVQRFMATSDASTARKALAAQLVVSVIVTTTLALVGFALLSAWKSDPSLLKAGETIKTNGDKLFPRFIGSHLPVGIAGLVVSAMFAAAMSSVDSGVNSITAVVMTDYLERFGWAPKSERTRVIFARCLAFGIGVTVVAASSLMYLIRGNITEVTNKTANLFTTPIFGLFVFALFIPFARPIGVWIGTMLGTITAILVAFSGPIVFFLYRQFGIAPETFGVSVQWNAVKQTEFVPDPVSFQWIGFSALVVMMVTGCLVCLLERLIFPTTRDDNKEQTR